jgi:hypothetical protein
MFRFSPESFSSKTVPGFFSIVATRTVALPSHQQLGAGGRVTAIPHCETAAVAAGKAAGVKAIATVACTLELQAFTQQCVGYTCKGDKGT